MFLIQVYKIQDHIARKTGFGIGEKHHADLQVTIKNHLSAVTLNPAAMVHKIFVGAEVKYPPAQAVIGIDHIFLHTVMGARYRGLDDLGLHIIERGCG